MAKIKLNGDVIANIPAAQVQAFLAEHDGNGLTVEYTALELRSHVREEIQQNAGDLHSLLGTASDAGGLVLVELLRLAAALAEADKTAQVRASAKRLKTLGAPFLEKIDNGEVQLPYMVKGEAAVMDDIATRGVAVSEALRAIADD
ncbi:hypothetical protein MHM39_14810 [Phaeobacter sp. CNT1-3]|nr:hypothetical protein [Phaeobacter sp. CNT1-3]